MLTTGWFSDLIGACRKVADKVKQLPSIPEKSK